MAYPITIDDNTTIPIETASTPLSTNHINNHTETRSAVIALESKVGVNNSAVTSTHDYKLNEVTGTDKTVGKTAAQAISNKTITASTLNGVNLTNAGGTSNFLRADGTYATPVIGAGSNTNYIQDSGTANAYVATLIPALGAYAAGVIVEFRATNANTGASTVNVSGLGVKSIFKLNGSTALVGGDIATGQVVTLRYDGTNFQMLSPSALSLTSSQLVSNVGATYLAVESITAGQAVTSYYDENSVIRLDTSVTNSTNVTSAGGTQTFSFTVASNSNRALVLYVNIRANSGIAALATATYNGVSIPQIVNALDSSINQFRLQCFVLTSPTVGTNNIVVTIGTSSATQYVCSNAISYFNTSGVDIGTSSLGASASIFYTVNTLGTLITSAVTPAQGPSTNSFSNQLYSGSNVITDLRTSDSGIAINSGSVAYANNVNATILVAVSLLPSLTLTFGAIVKSSASSVLNTVNKDKYTTFAGIAQNTVTAGQSINVLTNAQVTNQTGLIPLSNYFLSNTPGVISTTAGTNSKKVGFATSSTTLLLKDTI